MNKRYFLLFVFLVLFLVTAGTATAALDDFEDGDYTTDPTWTSDSTGGASIAVNTDNPRYGSYSVKMVTDGSNDNANRRLYYTWGYDIAIGEKMSYWVYTSSVGTNNNRPSINFMDSSGNFRLSFIIEGGVIKKSGNSVGASTLYASPSADTWYQLVLTRNSTNSWDFEVFDYNGTLLASDYNQNLASTNDIQQVIIQNNDKDTVSHTFYLDWASYEPQSTIEPPVEISNFSITAQDSYTDSSLSNFSALINGTTYTTTNGTIITDIMDNSTTLYVRLK